MRTVRELIRQHELVIFFVLVFFCTWLHAIPEVASSQGFGWSPPSPALKTILWLIGLLGGPLGSAALITALTRGRAGLREWFAPIGRWRVAWQWYLVVLFTYPIMAAAAILASGLVSGTGSHLISYFNARLGQIASMLGLSGARLWLFIPILLFHGFVVVPLYEEPGWRGFALPRLQQKHGALYSGVVLGIIWAFWHLPNFFIKGMPHYGMPFLGFLLSIIALSILMTAVYNSTMGSVLMAMLLHGSIIVGSIFFPAGLPNVTGDLLAYWFSVGAGVVAALVVIIIAGPGRLQIRGRTMSLR